MPYIDYCSEIWGNTNRYNLWPIFCLQKRVMQIIYKAKAHDYINNLFINLNVMKFFYYTEYKTAITMYKVKYNLLPKNIPNFFSQQTNVVMLQDRDKFKQMYIRTTLKAMCMTTVGVKL